MTQRVKKFIEEYIDEIEQGQWKKVFDSWYQETPVDKFYEDIEQFNELLTVMHVLNVDAQKLKDARAAVLKKYTEEIVNNIQNNYYNRVDSWSIYWNDVIVDLYSLLGFSQKEVFDLIFNKMDLDGVTPDYSERRFIIEGL